MLTATGGQVSGSIPITFEDYAVAVLASELTDPQDRSVLRMLVSALGRVPEAALDQLVVADAGVVEPRQRALQEVRARPVIGIG